jgi:hypothetical protein
MKLLLSRFFLEGGMGEWLWNWFVNHRWAIAWTSIFVSSLWILGPVAWVVHESSLPVMTCLNYLVWAKTSLQFNYLLAVAFIPLALNLGLPLALWIWAKFAARRDSEVQRLRMRLRDREWDIEKQKVEVDSHCQVKLHNANETIKVLEREARIRIEVSEMSLKAGNNLLESRKKELDDIEVDLEVRKQEITDKEKNLHYRERDLDEREQTLVKREQALVIREESTLITKISLGLEQGEVINSESRSIHKRPEEEPTPNKDMADLDKVTSLEKKIIGILLGKGVMRKRDLERAGNKYRYARPWDFAINNLLASGRIMYDSGNMQYIVSS